MTITKIIILVIWGLFGLLRYLGIFNDDIEPDVTLYKWYTILVHGPFWWFLAICQLITHGIERIKWSWLDNIFKLEKRDKEKSE